MTTRRAIGAALLLAGGVALFGVAPAYAAETPIPTQTPTPTEQVCDELDSGKIDVDGEVTSLEISADEGFVITRYCVKAGSANQEDGPEYVDVVPPAETVTITHSSGKAISHYSFEQEPVPTPTPTPTPTPPATTPPATTTPATPGATTPAGGGGGGASGGLAETGFDGGWLLAAGLGAVELGSIVVGERLWVARRRGA